MYPSVLAVTPRALGECSIPSLGRAAGRAGQWMARYACRPSLALHGTNACCPRRLLRGVRDRVALGDTSLRLGERERAH